jgi:class 3 adenylate cyclase
MTDKRTRLAGDELPPEVQTILSGEIHRGQRNTFVIRILFAILGILDALQVASSNSPRTTRITLAMGGFYLLFSVIGFFLVRKRVGLVWLRYLGITVDTTSVTVTALASLYNPSGAYEVLMGSIPLVLYMMFNVLTALQYSVRLSLFAALMAGLQRIGVLVYCATKHLVVLSPTSIYSQQALGLDDQVTNIVFIMVAGVIAAWVSHTSRRLLLQSAEATVRKRRLEKNQDVYRRYLSPHVRDQAMQHPEVLHLGGLRRVAVVLATEIRDFGTLADQLPPEEVVEILNRHYSILVEIVFRHGGTLDRFTEGGLSAIFGVPHDMPDAAGAAVRAAREMQEAVRESNGHHDEKKRSLRIEIGIAQGLVVAGNVGSDERMEYTVVGKAANLAGRLKAMAHILNADILMNAAAYDAVRGIYRAEQLPAELVNSMRLDSAVYRMDRKDALLENMNPALATAGSGTSLP